MKRMIVNADDFGFSEAVNHGILKAVGVHLNLTCYRPLLSTHQTLVTETGYFHKQDDVAGYSESEMYEELKAQIAVFLRMVFGLIIWILITTFIQLKSCRR